MDWININDELPEEGTYVLGIEANHSPTQIIVYYYPEGNGDDWGCDCHKCYQADSEPILKISHWQPLPVTPGDLRC